MLCEAKCVLYVPAMVGMKDGYHSLTWSLSGEGSQARILVKHLILTGIGVG